MSEPPSNDSPPPLPHVTSAEALEAALGSEILAVTANKARSVKAKLLFALRDVARITAFRDAVTAALQNGARRVVVLGAGGTGGTLAIQAVLAGADQVVAFEKDPILANLVRLNAGETLRTPAERNRLVVLETDVSRVQASSSSLETDNSWSVCTSSTNPRASQRHAFGDTSNDTIVAERCELLVVDALAVVNAIGVLDVIRDLTALREKGVFNTLLKTGHHTTTIPHSVNVSGQLVGGSNLGDGFYLRDPLGDREGDSRITGPCPGAAGTSIDTLNIGDASLERISDAVPLLCTAPGCRALGDDSGSSLTLVTCVEQNVIANVLRGSDSRRAARAAMTWWTIEVSKNKTLTSDPNPPESNQGPVRPVTGTRPVTVTLLPEVLDVPTDARLVCLKLSRKNDGAGVNGTILETFLVDGEKPVSPTTFEEKQDYLHTTSGEKQDNLGKKQDSLGTPNNLNPVSPHPHVCRCAAHLLWGVTKIARWNDLETNAVFFTAVQKAVAKTGAKCGAVLDIGNGPLMSLLAARAFETNKNPTHGNPRSNPRSNPKETNPSDANPKEEENPRQTVLCLERDCGAARFSRAVLGSANVGADVCKVAALGRHDATGFSFYGNEDKETLNPILIPILEPVSSILQAVASIQGSASDTGSLRGNASERTDNHREDTTHHDKNDTNTYQVQVGIGADLVDNTVCETRVDSLFVATSLWNAAVTSASAKERHEDRYFHALSNFRKVFLKAVKQRELPRRVSYGRYGTRYDNSYDVRYDDSFDRNDRYDDGYRYNDYDYDRGGTSADRDLFDAYCSRDSVEITTEQLTRLGFGGVDFEEIENDPAVERAQEALTQATVKFARAKECAQRDWDAAYAAKTLCEIHAATEVNTLRGAATRALGKMPAWVLLCDPFSLGSGDGFSGDELGRLGSSSMGKQSDDADGWGDVSLASLVRRRLWARRAGILHVNFVAVPTTAVVMVVTLSCPEIVAQLKGETFSSERQRDRDETANDSKNEKDSLDRRVHNRLASTFRDVRGDTQSAPPLRTGGFRAPIATCLSDWPYPNHVVVGKPRVAMRLELAGDGYDAEREREVFSNLVSIHSSSEVTRVNPNTSNDPTTPVDAFGFWIEYDTGAGWVRTTDVLCGDAIGVKNVSSSRNGDALKSDPDAREKNSRKRLRAPSPFSEKKSSPSPAWGDSDVTEASALGDEDDVLDGAPALGDEDDVLDGAFETTAAVSKPGAFETAAAWKPIKAKPSNVLSAGRVGVFVLPRKEELAANANRGEHVGFDVEVKFDASITTGGNFTVKVVETCAGE